MPAFLYFQRISLSRRISSTLVSIRISMSRSRSISKSRIFSHLSRLNVGVSSGIIKTLTPYFFLSSATSSTKLRGERALQHLFQKSCCEQKLHSWLQPRDDDAIPSIESFLGLYE